MKMRFNYLILSLLVLIVSCKSLDAQPRRYSTDSKKAIKHFETAQSFLRDNDYERAQYYLDKALDKDENFSEVYIVKGDISAQNKQDSMAVMYYEKAYALNPQRHVKLLYYMAKVELRNGWYDSAYEHIYQYSNSDQPDPRLAQQVSRMLLTAEFGAEQVKKPVPFEPVNLGKNVNSRLNEMVNTISTDGQLLIITVALRADQNTVNKRARFEEDFFVSTLEEDGSWGMVQDLGRTFNSNGNEGSMALSPDGRTMVYTACDRPQGVGRCDLYISEKEGDKWTKVKNMGKPVNTEAWESQATLSVDGKTMYFISNRRGGEGKSDIWKTERNDDGSWTEPVNLGDVINTPGMEYTPFLHPDGKTLYFASDGHVGMGGLDFFMSTLNSKGQWSEPVNLGYPINTHLDEKGMIINAQGDLAYYSSERPGGIGKLDIYSFEVYNDIRPTKVNYMRGIVRNKANNKPIKAKFELVDLSTGQTIVTSESDSKTGAFFVCIPSDREFALKVEKENFLFYSDNFTVSGIHSVEEPFEKNVLLKPFQKDEVIQLKNVFFETAKYNLTEKSFIELDNVVALLTKNPKLKIEVGGHTDNVGDDADNQSLSANRAKAVYDYLISKGIAAERLSWKGYGETKPIDSNETEVGRSNNRRTELKVIGVE